MTQAEQYDATQAPSETTTAAAGPIRAYKAFDKNMRCRGFQFGVGQTYEHDGPVKACESGFHACENPLDVWSYYPLDSRYAVVELGGDVSRHDSDSKIAAARITISAEIALPQIISDGVAYLTGLCKDAFALKPGGHLGSGYTGAIWCLASARPCQRAGTQPGRSHSLAQSQSGGSPYRRGQARADASGAV